MLLVVKALAVFVPPPSLAAYRKVQTRLTRELEKKFPDRHVVFLAERRILPKPARKARKQQKRPRSRTLTAVHDKILEDLVFPTEIIGKRVRYLVGGNKIQKSCWTLRTPPLLTTNWTLSNNCTPN